MKSYYLHLKNTDFTRQGNNWISRPIDLYDNTKTNAMATPSYVNYSSTKSAYGLNLLGDNTWTGLDLIGAASPNYVTDSGYIKDGRFVDTSGKISLSNWQVDYVDFSNTDVKSFLTVYNSDRSDLSLSQWTEEATRLTQTQGVFINTLERYLIVSLDFESNLDLSNLVFDFYLKVRISKPVINPLYSKTQGILRNFPEWMELRKDSIAPATPELATPVTIAGAFVNALSGEWLEDIFSTLSSIQLERFIETASTETLAWVYVTSGVPDKVIKVKGDGVELSRANDVDEFSKASKKEDIFYWDENNNVIYSRKLYTEFLINEISYLLNQQAVWNWFDEHGLSVDLERHAGESNDSFKKRILDVYRNKPGVGMEAFKLALRREFNLWRFEGATPDSNYLGATPEVLELDDLLLDTTGATPYVTPDGLPTQRLETLVDQLAEKYPTTWGYFKWDETYWDAGGQDGRGYKILPYKYDSNSIDSSYLDSGVGDGNDLLVYPPDAVVNPREFNTTITALVHQATPTLEYRPIEFDLKIYGRARKTVFNNPTVEPKIHVSATDGYGRRYISDPTYSVPVKSNIDFYSATPTSESYVTIPLLERDQPWLSTQLNWYDVENDRYLNQAYQSISTGYLNDTLEHRYFKFIKNSISSLQTPQFEVGSVITLYSGESVIRGTVVSVSNSFTADDWSSTLPDDSAYDYLIINNVTSSGDITAQEWYIPEYLFVFGDNLSSSKQIQSATVGFGSYKTEEKIFTSLSTQLIPSQSLRLFTFTKNTIYPSQGKIKIGNKVTFYKDAGSITGTITDISQSYNGNTSYDYVFISDITYYNVSSTNTDAGWKIIANKSILSIASTPSNNVVMWLSDNDYATPNNFINAKTNLAGRELFTKLQADVSVVLSSLETATINNTFWEGEPVEYRARVNSSPFNNIQNSWKELAPTVLWDTYLSSVPNKEVIVEILTKTTDGYGGVAYSDDNATPNSATPVFIPKENIYINNKNNWTQKYTYDATPLDAYYISISENEDIEAYVNATGLNVYPIKAKIWGDLQKTIEGPSGVVDKNGVWKNGQKPRNNSSNYTVDVVGVSKNDFGIPDTDNYSIKEYLVTSDDQKVITWIDGQEKVGNQDQLTIKAKLKSEIDSQWNPQIHSGWFYDKDDEYYLYTVPTTETVSSPLTGATYNHYYASDVARQGAPIIVNALIGTPATPNQLRQVSFFDDNVNLTLQNTQRMYGNGTSNLYLAYPDIYDATVSDITSGTTLNAMSKSSTNILPVEKILSKYYVMPGLSGYHITTPDKSGIPSGTTNLDVRVKISVNNWNTVGTQYLASQYSGSSSGSSFDLYIQNNKLYFTTYGLLYYGGTGLSTHTSNIALSGILPANTAVWLRATWTDSAIAFISFYYSYDGLSWSPLGSNVISNCYSISSSAHNVTLGTLNTSTATNRFSGKLYGFELYSGSTKVLDFDPNDAISPYYNSLKSSSTGETWTITRTNQDNGYIRSPLYLDQYTSAIYTTPDHVYEVSYKLKNSFYVDNDYIDNTGKQRSKFVFDLPPSAATPYSITYETSKFEEATPIDIALNPLYSDSDEQFVYMSFNEYPLSSAEINLSPSRLLANNEDYAILSIKSLDINKNPKPNQQFNVITTFGTFEESKSKTATVTTDIDGYATLTLNSELNNTNPPIDYGTVTISKGSVVFDTLNFVVDSQRSKTYSLIADVKPDAIPSDGKTGVSVYGLVRDRENNPVPYAYVSYSRGRSMYEVFSKSKSTPNTGPYATPSSTPYWLDSGRVIADNNGEFILGPFASATPDDSGYWFMAAESFESSRYAQYAILDGSIPSTSSLNLITTGDVSGIPSDASPSRTTVIDARVKVAPNNWNTSSVQNIFGQWSATGTNRFFKLYIQNNKLLVSIAGITPSTGATASTTKTGTLNLSSYFTDGQPGWLRFVWSNIGSSSITFYYSLDGIKWENSETFSYTNSQPAYPYSTTTSRIALGTDATPTTTDRLSGKIYNFELYSGPSIALSNATPILNFNINDAVLGQSNVVSSKTGETWKFTGTASLYPLQWEAAGDVVYWQEYPPRVNALENENLIPITPINDRGRLYLRLDSSGNWVYDRMVPESATINAFPVGINEATPLMGATPVTNIWSPPKWYALPLYEQYQRGLLGDDFYTSKNINVFKIHPDYKDM